MPHRDPAPTDSAADFDKLLKEAAKTAKYVLRLYVTGATDRSTKAIANIRTVCEQHLKGHYDLRVVDIYQQPSLAQSQQIIAAPTLIKSRPLPLKRLVGDLSDHKRLLTGLNLSMEPETGGANG